MSPVTRLIVFVFLATSPLAIAGDWPMWRHDVQRSASTPNDLPAKLRMQWALELPPLKPAWPDQPMMPFDAVYEPIVAGQTMYVASPRTDSVTAYDTRSGRQRWRFMTDGPIRFAPIWHEGKLYFTSDDGFLYCLDASSGEMKWRFRGGPSDRHILGNERLISTWPARGAPVIADGVIYFAASIWPFMGIFIHALDAETGKPIWTNDGDGSIYIKQPHSTDSFAGVAPQGPMAIAGDLLFIPGGRSVPAAYDRKTGKQRHFLLNENSKKGGGHIVAVAGNVFFNGPGAFLVKNGKYLGTGGTLFAADGNKAYVWKSSDVVAIDLNKSELKERKWKPKVAGTAEIRKATAMIRAGNRLYFGMSGKVAAIDLPLPDDEQEEFDSAWEIEVDGTPLSLVAADDRLFVSTKEGRIFCLGSNETPVAELADTIQPRDVTGYKEAKSVVARVFESTGVREGYAVVWSAEIAFLKELVRQSTLHVIAVDPDAAKVKAAREALIAADLYGDRCSVHVGDPATFALPPYMASLMIAPSHEAQHLPKLFTSLRPYGGTLFVSKANLDELHHATNGLLKAAIKKSGADVLVIREGALPGAGTWTHEHADAANTRVSKDSLVKAPLGILWFGGTSNEGILPRHGHGPQPQVVGGRIIIEGTDMLRAVDVYTGRLLWEAKLPGLGTFYNNTAHQPGANARGTNYISLPDGIYVAYKTACLRLDPATGKKVAEFPFPPVGDDLKSPRWGHLNVVGDYLIGLADPLFTEAAEKRAKSPARIFKFAENDLFATSRHLAVLDRHSGKLLWTATAESGFRHNTLCAGNGKLFAIDRLSGPRLARMKEDGEDAPESCIMAWDLATGKELWHDDSQTFGTWLSYSEKFDVLVEAGRVARDTLIDEPKGMRAYRGSDGKELWFNKSYVGPAMIHGDTILRGQGASDLLTGKPKMRHDPITGELVEWIWSRNYGCNTPAASEHLLTFRSGAAGYFDLCCDGGTGNFGGFRSSCTNNLIVADGVLAAPDYTRTCTCSYQNQCSIAFVPMPDAEEWTFYGKAGLKKAVDRVGINFGAPGDRKAANGTLWLEYPFVGGASPTVSVFVVGKKATYFRRHQSTTTGAMPWVTSSGVADVDGIVVKLLSKEMPDRHYRVRLHFAEPEDLRPGERLFDVVIQGQRALDDFDVVKEAGDTRKSVVKEFRGIEVEDELHISFRPRGKRGAILCGIEIVQE